MVVLVTSKVDLASKTLKTTLLRLYQFKEVGEAFGNPVYQLEDITLVTVNDELTRADYLEEKLGKDVYIYLSRHEAMAKRPSLLVHTPGNWLNKAEHGGKPMELAKCYASAEKQILREINSLALDLTPGYQVSLEATHHGPTSMESPVIFVEVGSSEKEWRDEKAAEVLARAVVNSMPFRDFNEVYVGVGGPHYAPEFTRLNLETGIAVSHIAPRYVFDEGFNLDMLRVAAERTKEPVKGVLVHWKGLKSNHKQKLLDWLDKTKVKWEKLERIKK